jgi:TonB-linked SusC/RagA family outer membrane protein
MNLNLQSRDGCNRFVYQKILLVMKLITLLFIAAIMQVSASTFAQKITLNKNQASLRQIMYAIRAQSGYDFLYNNNILKNAHPVTINVKDASIDEVLAICFTGQPISYKVEDRSVLLKTKENTVTNKLIRQVFGIPVKGKVVDEKGQPIPGVTILEKGTKNEVASNGNGEFTINVKDDAAVLVFSFVGYQNKELTAGGVGLAAIALIPSESKLDEVVVVGYGAVRKQDLTGAVGSIDAKELKNLPITRVDQMIQGKAAGVQVTSGNGVPGGGSSIRIRGGNSINSSNEPLYVIDGLIGGGDINTLNPEDIASLVILKDASSTAIYGARGANGVILITTKKGTIGQDNINFNSYYGWQKIPKLIDVLNAREYAQLANEGAAENQQPLPYNLDTIGEGTNWQKAISQVAPMQNYTLNASGGTGGDKGYSYFLSGNYNNQQGVIINSGFKRYQFRSNLSKSISGKLKIGAIINIGKTETKNNTITLGGVDFGANSAISYSPIPAVYNADGSFTQRKPFDTKVYDNPVAQGTLPINNSVNTNFTGNLFAEFELLKGLKFKSTFSSEINALRTNIYLPGSLPTRTFSVVGGQASVNTESRTMWLNENTLTYVKDIDENNSINAVAGFTYQNTDVEYLNGASDRFTTDYYTYNYLAGGNSLYNVVGSRLVKRSLASTLARINYTFKNKYLFTITGRADGSSVFPVKNKYAFFPAAAIGWNVSNEEFIKKLNVFNNLKLRASFGYTGAEAIAPYSSQAALRIPGNSYIIGDTRALIYVPDRVENPNLKWETTRQFDLGLEMAFFKNRLSFEIDYYSKLTTDLLLDEQLPTQTGYTSRVNNLGSISNKGLEVLVTSRNIENADFKWQTTFNIATNQNKAVDIGGVDGYDLLFTGAGTYSVISRVQKGQPIGTFWGAIYAGTQKSTQIPDGLINPRTTPRLGDPLYKDLNGDKQFTTADYTVIGRANPKFYGGLGNTFTYKQLSLNVFLQGSYGNQVMNVSDIFNNTSSSGFNQFGDVRNRWTPSNPISDVPRLNSQDLISSSRWVYNGSFLRLKSLTLTYALTSKDLGAKWIKGLNVFATGTNLFLITKYPYYDPETNAYGTNSTLRGFDYTNYPQNRTFAMGINLTL